ncbi:MAG TPA: hypothetical protein VFA30_01980 [Gaiellaceae bacterium]|nr:hypothetical protein [Gaiellaceae bacterium]
MTRRPVVAVLCSTPIVAGAVESTLEFAEVRSFEAGRDTRGLLASLRPDAVVVDNDDDARDAVAVSAAPVLHIGVRTRSMRLFRDGAWAAMRADSEPEEIRNALAGALFGRGAGGA